VLVECKTPAAWLAGITCYLAFTEKPCRGRRRESRWQVVGVESMLASHPGAQESCTQRERFGARLCLVCTGSPPDSCPGKEEQGHGGTRRRKNNVVRARHGSGPVSTQEGQWTPRQCDPSHASSEAIKRVGGAETGIPIPIAMPCLEVLIAAAAPCRDQWRRRQRRRWRRRKLRIQSLMCSRLRSCKPCTRKHPRRPQRRH